ncbi:MAG: hypothetical protein GX595_06495, partial [Lentisphaerae bacterium]|nr:hypothetical protein [Lentisphaerota bacterium]
TLHSLRCDCGEQLERALQMIGDADCGVLDGGVWCGTTGAWA